MSNTVDLIVSGDSVLTVDDAGTIVPRGAVAIRDGIIIAVGPLAELRETYQAEHVIDSPGCVVLPGWVNTHTHLAMNVFRGQADDVTLEEFLERLVGAELRVLDGEMVEVGARAAIAECLRGGTTSALDMYWYPQVTRAVAAEAGFRLLNGPTFMGESDPEGRDFEGMLARAQEILESNRAERPDEGLWVMPHSAYTLNDEQLRRVQELAAQYGARINTHSSESPSEMTLVDGLHGGSPVEVFFRTGLLTDKTMLAHSVQLSDTDIATMAEAGAAVAHCPVSNLKLGCGIARIPDLLATGVPVGLGTDGAASTGTLDMFAAARMAALLHKGVVQDPTMVTAEQAIRMGTVDGARSLGMDDVGTLEPGMRADIQVVRVNTIHTAPTPDVWAAIAYSANAADVQHTIVNGRVVLQDGVLTTIDEPAALSALAESAAKASG